MVALFVLFVLRMIAAISESCEDAQDECSHLEREDGACTDCGLVLDDEYRLVDDLPFERISYDVGPNSLTKNVLLRTINKRPTAAQQQLNRKMEFSCDAFGVEKSLCQGFYKRSMEAKPNWRFGVLPAAVMSLCLYFCIRLAARPILLTSVCEVMGTDVYLCYRHLDELKKILCIQYMSLDASMYFDRLLGLLELESVTRRRIVSKAGELYRFFYTDSDFANSDTACKRSTMISVALIETALLLCLNREDVLKSVSGESIALVEKKAVTHRVSSKLDKLFCNSLNVSQKGLRKLLRQWSVFVKEKCRAFPWSDLVKESNVFDFVPDLIKAY